VREGVSLGIGGGQAGEDYVGRVHGVFGMRGSVSGGKSVAAWAEGRADADVGVRGGSRGIVFRYGGGREGGGILEVGCAVECVPAVGAACERGESSDARGSGVVGIELNESVG